jgi:magnesium chelatase family protein
MYSKINSLGLFGLNAYKVTTECDIQRGAVPKFDIVGLPDAAVKEAKDRVSSAIKNSGFLLPIGKITINLAPADVKKAGSVYDLPILLSILRAAEKLSGEFEDAAFIGELSLSGELRPAAGILPMTLEARKTGIKRLFIPADNSAEASVVRGMDVYPVRTASELCAHIDGSAPIPKLKPHTGFKLEKSLEDFLDFSDVRGQQGAKRALEIAAAGGHNVLMTGSPGSGKSMLAKRLGSILPPMTFEESIETTKIYSIAGLVSEKNPLITRRPFRSPHHSASPAALAGGGSEPKPGEISLAHNGVLFLDEFPEFPRDAIEVLRQPMEDGEITISRAKMTVKYPCNIMLVAAMNPCPCGYYGHPVRKCICSSKRVLDYIGRISGPLLDRMDLNIEVAPVEFSQLTEKNQEESSAAILERVKKARAVQNERYKNIRENCNASLSPGNMSKFCKMTPEAVAILKKVFDRLGLSARAYDKILKVARTIADLGGSGEIRREHVAEAVQYRSLDRKYWTQ